MTNKVYYPLDTKLVSEWPGPRDGGSWWHYGTDFAVPVNTPLRACFDGRIDFAGGDGAFGSINGVTANGEGLTVDIVRLDGLRARYGHMNRIDVSRGQYVKAGQIIGLSGNTGFTTGPHCHWELRWDNVWSGGDWVDPRKIGAINFPKHERKNTVSTSAIYYYKHAQGKNKEGWLVLGATPNALIVSTQKSANEWADRIGEKAKVTNYGGFKTYLRAAGGTNAQLRAVSKG